MSAPPPVPARDYGRYISTGEDDVFHNAISLNPPPGYISMSNTHPVKLPKFYNNPNHPVQTNNFYGNLLVEEQNLPVWTHPYSIWKSNDNQFKGLGISHTSANQRVFGDDPNTNPVKYFFNPVGICSMMLSAAEFEQGFDFAVGDLTRFSAGLKFSTASGELQIHLVQGMGFITGNYSGNITPRIASKVGVQSFQNLGSTSNGLNKYLAVLFDNTKWIVYSNNVFTQESPHSIIGQPNHTNTIIQIAKLSDENTISYYDMAAGAYVVDCSLSGKTIKERYSYTFNYKTLGHSTSGKVLHWFLPHHVDSMESELGIARLDGLVLDSTCKGPMTAFLINQFTMTEKLLPQDLLLDPWSDQRGVKGYSDAAKSFIEKVASAEVDSFDVVNESDTDSMYTSGKILDKGAFILYVTAFVLKNQNLTQTMLHKMKLAFQRFIDNTQKAPLCYDNKWKGIISTSGLSDGNFYCDFGNCFYNDHHFHYGYHVHAAAIVALVDNQFGDQSWLTKARPWVETLIRDYCNPVSNDPYFPQLRSFDFYNGHSFANGLFAHGDGKDEESSSEDYHAHYAVKLWGYVTGNKQLDTLGSLILAIEKRAIGMYMLYKNSNNIMPPNFIGNKVSGILFENKVDHATYFGMNKEYIHGIHMIPITPVSNYVRDSEFVTEEWNQMQLSSLAESIDGGWKGLLMLNCAMVDPVKAWRFFSQPNFQQAWLDNGMSRTWSLAYCAGMGGA
ncbi:hypothetical protein CANINC_004512 [Pichia inconspicua]|uniref:glucan endo-1,3-beta-D-glucosidase n=1 Tax=Pichia inconspicua TaxID=52247 RepID=A0A4T0WVG2_9ASCO|nr:hypothetical protein CANINC_004512 [[Candida] inconspicua]